MKEREVNFPELEEARSSPVIDLDRILVEEIGQFGWFQVVLIAITAVSSVFTAMAASEYIFTAGRLPTRCLIPGCDGTTPEWEPAWLGNAVPGSPGNYDECNRFLNISTPSEPLLPDTCPADLFDRSVLVSCDQYVHERTNTVVYDFGLECDEWRRSFIGSIRIFGVLVSLAFTGPASDRFGRRIVFCVSVVFSVILGISRAFVNTYAGFVALQFLEALFQGYFSTAMVIVTEFVGPRYRTVAGPTLSCFVGLGFAVLGLISWAVQYWRHLTLAIFVPQLLTFGFYWIMPESVRWLISKQRFEEAEKVLQKAARMNNTFVSDETLKLLRESSYNKDTTNDNEQSSPKTPHLAMQVLRSRVILSRCCVTPIWWISSIMVYYGVSLNAVSLAGNSYLNYVYVSLIEIPGYLSAMVVLNRVGRKPTLFLAFMVCAACQFIFAFLPNNYPTTQLILYLLGKYCISVVVTSLYVYTAELYPTNCRHTLLAFSSMIGRIGGIIAPLTPALMVYWAGIPSVLFGSLTLISALLVLTTPETLNTKLPDTIAEAELLRGRTTQPA